MPAKHWSTDTYSVTRRFGVGLMLLGTVYCVGLLVVLKAVRVGFPWSFYFLSALMLFVGVAQAALARLGSPRAVSMVAGAVFSSGWAVVVAGANGHLFLVDPTRLTAVACSGLLLGYVAGSIDASLFLVHDWLTLRRRLRDHAHESLDLTPGGKRRESPFDD
ncbi:hypothetical protein [Botrimarina sp.]|uniref:hypothetical protein n=1 Tax=Botrimarina sp. TaxID=2795802 RepID=UPI0032EF05EE